MLVNHALYFADLGLRRASDGRVGDPPRARRGRLRRGPRARGRGRRVARRADRLGTTCCASRATRSAPASSTAPAGRTRRSSSSSGMLAALVRSAAAHGRVAARLREPELRALPAAALAGALASLASALEGAGEECDLTSPVRPMRLGSALLACQAAEDEDAVAWHEPLGHGRVLCAAARSTSARCCARRCGTRWAPPCCARPRSRSTATSASSAAASASRRSAS